MNENLYNKGFLSLYFISDICLIDFFDKNLSREIKKENYSLKSLIKFLLQYLHLFLLGDYGDLSDMTEDILLFII